MGRRPVSFWLPRPWLLAAFAIASAAGGVPLPAATTAESAERLGFGAAMPSTAEAHPDAIGSYAGRRPPLQRVATAGGEAQRERSVVFRKEAAEEIRLAQATNTIHVFGYRDDDERRAPLRTLEARFASALDAGSPELTVGQSRRHDCLYIGAIGFSCADPISSLLVNLKWHLR